MRMLITGGAGFIGSHLCDKYTKEGDTVLCLDNFTNGNLMNIRPLLNYRNFKLINGDIRDSALLERLMRGVDVIFHLAAQIHVDRSIIEPKFTYDVNVLGTQNVLEAARMWDVNKVIYSSTSEVYGSAEYAPMDENHPLNAPHPYGASKAAADRMCHAYIETYGMDISKVRLFNTFGPKQKDSGYGGVISIFVKRVLSGMPPVIYGDGEQTRDYVYITDTVNAFDLVLNHNEPVAKPVNFGTGREVSIIALAKMILKLCGKEDEIKPVHVEARPGEVRRLVAQNSRAKEIFGWEPKVNFEEGLKEFIDWYKNYKSEEWVKPS